MRLTALIIFWQNTLPANIRKLVFSWNKRDGITWRNYKFAWNSCVLSLWWGNLCPPSSPSPVRVHESDRPCPSIPGTLAHASTHGNLDCACNNLEMESAANAEQTSAEPPYVNLNYGSLILHDESERRKYMANSVGIIWDKLFIWFYNSYRFKCFTWKCLFIKVLPYDALPDWVSASATMVA